MSYQRREYRSRVNSPGLSKYRIIVEESDIFISTTGCYEEAARKILCHTRREIKKYIESNPYFASSLKPLREDYSMPESVALMARASSLAGVGPMAAVAGVISLMVGRELSRYSDEVIVENGGDIFIKSAFERTVAIFAGDSPLSMKLGIKVSCAGAPAGVCTSSATVGHSVSFGRADAVVCLGEDSVITDAAATSIGNRVRDVSDIKNALNEGLNIPGIEGCLIIEGENMGAAGNIQITKL